jgi:hypothetical protein
MKTEGYLAFGLMAITNEPLELGIWHLVCRQIIFILIVPVSLSNDFVRKF